MSKKRTTDFNKLRISMIYSTEQLPRYTKPQMNSLTLELQTEQDDDRPVFVVGNFNDWTTEDPRYQMRRLADGHFTFTFLDTSTLPQPLQYKYARGGWENKELDQYGFTTPNRTVAQPKGKILDKVPRWSSYGLTFLPRFLPKIEVLSNQLDMPQLGRKRRVVVLLPHDYVQNTDKKYAVLYLHDAQNLFDENAPYGTWGINKSLAVLAERGMKDVIVVAIDHGGAERIQEFLPFSSRLGKSQGREYVRFMVETLKPHIDRTYRTLTDRLHTGIGGSSLGGLISIYAGLMYPKTYGRMLIFSPSLWVTRNVQFDTIRFFDPLTTKIYIYAGGKEGSNMVPNVEKLKNAVRKQGFDGSTVDINLVVDPEGEHNEARWGQEFPKALEWLFY